jgi:hypothetical protein
MSLTFGQARDLLFGQAREDQPIYIKLQSGSLVPAVTVEFAQHDGEDYNIIVVAAERQADEPTAEQAVNKYASDSTGVQDDTPVEHEPQPASGAVVEPAE